MAYSTVDSYIGKLRYIFSDIGRQGDWNRTFLLGNPASDLLVKQYLKEVPAEHLRVHITPNQAVPLFPDKLLLLSGYLEKRVLLPSLSPAEIFITARDQAFFKALFFSGERGGDLGKSRHLSMLVSWTTMDSCLIILQDGASNLFGMRRHPNPTLCPIRAIETYVAIVRELGISLSCEYLFSSTNPQGRIVDTPF